MKKTIIVLLTMVILLSVAMFILPKTQKAKPVATPKEKSLAEKTMEKMTLEEKAGQMFFVCVSNDSISKKDITSYNLGGYLFFADFFENRSSKTATADIASYQKAAKIPMFMGADEEGGTVVRASKYAAYRSAPFASPQALYKEGGLDRIAQDAAEKSEFLQSLGINVNLAPVCDMTSDKNAFIYSRTLGEDAETTSDYIAKVVKVMKEKKMGSTLKHFPGYGGNADTHTGIATDKRSYETFTSNDFLPFRAGIDAGAPSVLVSHNIVTCMDKTQPASLSKKVHEILRRNLHFDGVIMTDDLSMDGVQGYSGDENIAVAAIEAGNDLLCTNNYADAIPAVIAAVKKGKISEKQINASVIRILEWKESLGLLEKK